MNDPWHNQLMAQALNLARKGAAAEEVPIGALVVEVETGRILGAAHNETFRNNDPTAHAEILAIRAACLTLGSPYLPTCDLIVTLEPCPMCAQAVAFARIRRLVYAAGDPKGGGVEHGPRIFQQPTCHHRPEIFSGIMEEEAGNLLRGFFSERR